MNNDQELATIRHQLVSGDLPTGSILAQVMGDLAPTELEKLKNRAADGLLGLELEKLSMSHRFQSSSVEIQEFINKIKELESGVGKYSSYKARGEFNTASGRTTIEAKKGCYVATAVYGNEFHPNVLILKKFRDETLMRSALGRLFCRSYYMVSPSLSNHFHKGLLSVFCRKFLNVICKCIQDS